MAHLTSATPRGEIRPDDAAHELSRPARAVPTADEIWRAIAKASFAVLSHAAPSGEPRSSGVVYGLAGHRVFVVVAANSWKARTIKDGQRVALTVPVRRGGLLSLVAPIPPATISFTARVSLHPAGSFDIGSVSKSLESLLPKDRRSAVVLELLPEGAFLTYGIGVSLLAMRDPAIAQAHVPVS